MSRLLCTPIETLLCTRLAFIPYHYKSITYPLRLRYTLVWGSIVCLSSVAQHGQVWPISKEKEEHSGLSSFLLSVLPSQSLGGRTDSGSHAAALAWHNNLKISDPICGVNDWAFLSRGRYGTLDLTTCRYFLTRQRFLQVVSPHISSQARWSGR